MITDHIKPNLVFEPTELRALQSAFDVLKVRFEVQSEADKAVLGMLLIGAFDSSRDMAVAEKIAGERYAELNKGNQQHHS